MESRFRFLAVLGMTMALRRPYTRDKNSGVVSNRHFSEEPAPYPDTGLESREPFGQLRAGSCKEEGPPGFRPAPE